MLLPTQQATYTASTSLMQSVIDDAEKRRVEDDEKLKGKKEDKVLKARLRSDDAQRSASDKINAHFFEKSGLDVNEMKVQFIQSLGKFLGIEKQDGQSGFSYGRQLENAIAQLDSMGLYKLNEKLGLPKLGIALDEVIKAIKNPYGDEDDKLETKLEERATGISGTTLTRAKVAQRLETVASPKTLEELKLEQAGAISDPTAIEDDDTKAERQKEIGALEASGKLDDIKDLHEAVKKQNDAIIKSESGEASSADVQAVAIDTIQVLAAGAETTVETEGGDTSDALVPVAVEMEDDGPTGANGKNDISLSEEDEVYLITANGPDMTDAPEAAILPVEVDENGIYALLAKEKAAA